MEYYSGQHNETTPEEPNPRTVERLSNWVTGLQTEVKGAKPSQEASPEQSKQPESELQFERSKEIRDVPRALKRGSMIAVGEVLADKSSDQPTLVGAAGIKAAKQKKLTREEHNVSTKPTVSQGSGLTARQAVQLGVLVGVCVAMLLLVWLSVR